MAMLTVQGAWALSTPHSTAKATTAAANILCPPDYAAAACHSEQPHSRRCLPLHWQSQHVK